MKGEKRQAAVGPSGIPTMTAGLTGCRIEDPEDHVQEIPDFEKLAARTADEILSIPSQLPVTTPHNTSSASPRLRFIQL